MGRSHERTEIQGPAVPQITDAHRAGAVHVLLAEFNAVPDAFNVQLGRFLEKSINDDGSVDLERLHPVLRGFVEGHAEMIARMTVPPLQKRELAK